MKEATRDGAPPIDLLDGSDISEQLRELKLGVRTENIEVVEMSKLKDSGSRVYEGARLVEDDKTVIDRSPTF